MAQVSILVNETKLNQTFALPFEVEQPKKSGQNVVKLGLILFCFSCCLCVNAIATGIVGGQWLTSGITATCGFLFVILSLLSMYGESGESKMEKQILIGCIGLTVVGVGAIIMGINFNVESWNALNTECLKCKKPANNDQVNVINENVTNLYIQNLSLISEFTNDPLNWTLMNDELTSTFVNQDFLSNLTVNSTLEAESCDWFCESGRVALFLILIGLLICIGVISIGLSYVIFITRFRKSDYVPAVTL